MGWKEGIYWEWWKAVSKETTLDKETISEEVSNILE